MCGTRYYRVQRLPQPHEVGLALRDTLLLPPQCRRGVRTVAVLLSFDLIWGRLREQTDRSHQWHSLGGGGNGRMDMRGRAGFVTGTACAPAVSATTVVARCCLRRSRRVRSAYNKNVAIRDDSGGP